MKYQLLFHIRQSMSFIQVIGNSCDSKIVMLYYAKSISNKIYFVESLSRRFLEVLYII